MTSAARTTPPWLLAAKITAPERAAGFFRRSTITDRVEPFEHRLLAVKAPAGFGKTTLLADLYHAARETGVLAAWVTLDEDDTPPVFAEYLINAFERAGLDTGSLHELRNAGTPTPQLQQRVATLMRMIERHAAPCLLVLDEAERLADPETVEAVESVLRYPAQNLRVAVAFRENPGFDLSAAILGGRGISLTEAELRFSTAEIAAFVGDALSRRELAAVAERTEGWPAALQIYRNDRNAGRAMGPAGRNGDTAVADYCNARLLRGVSQRDREFMLDLALFDWIDPPLVDEVLETADSERRLDTHSALSGFVTILNDGDVRRLHPLIREYCAAERFRTDPDRFRDLHRRLATAMESRGRLAKAMRHARAAGDPRRAGEMLERAGGLRLWRREGSAQLETADRFLCADTLAAYPRLALARCLLRIRQGKFDEARTLYESVRRDTQDFARDRDGGDDKALGTDAFIVRALFVGYGCQLLGSEAVQSLFATGHALARDATLPAETRGALHELLAIAYFQLAQFDTCEALGARAGEMFAGNGTPRGAMNVDFVLGMLAMARGRVKEATQLYASGRRKAEKIFPRDPGPALIGDVLTAELALERNEAGVEEAAEGFPARLRGTAAWLDIYAGAFAVAAELTFVRHGPKAALAFLDDSRVQARTVGLPSVTRFLSALRVTVLVRTGRDDRAANAWEVSGLPAETPDVLDLDRQSWREMEAIAEARVRLLTARREFDRARELVEGLCRVAAERGLARTRLRGLALAVAVEHRAGARDAADARLAEYLRAAAECDYVRPLVRDRAISVTVLRRLSETHSDPDTRASAEAMALRLGATTAAAPLSPSSPVAPALTARERAVLDGVARGDRDKEIAATLNLTSDGVRYHLTRVYRKLHAGSRGVAVRRARELGVLP